MIERSNCVVFRLVAVLACCGLAGSGHACAAEPKPQGWAVLVGIDDYANATKLRFCGADQRGLRDRLVAAGFSSDQVVLLEDEAKESRHRPSRLNIERQIGQVLGFAEEGDVVVVGFSGHGTQIGDRSYLVPADGDPADASTLLPLDDLYGRLRSCAAGVKLVFVDACRNDVVPGGRRTAEPSGGARALARSLSAASLPEGVVLFNSCAEGEISWEDESIGHGVFMNYVLEGLDGKAESNGDGAVSINELRSYAALRTKTFVSRQFNHSQRPFLRADADGDLLDYALLPVPKVPVGGRPVEGMSAKPGTVTTNSIGMKLVVIPAGEFDMGSTETDGQLEAAGFVLADKFDSSDERPVHRVRITKPFRMGIHEVTLGQFLSFYHAAYKGRLDCETNGQGGDGYNASKPDRPFETKPSYRPWSWGHPAQTNDHPVVNVGWNDCVAFCEWLSRKEGKRYRLPTEAEWEYACRAGTRTRFWFGDDPEGLAAVANVPDATAKGMFPWWNFAIRGRDGHAFSTTVGAFDCPNPFGLHDMHGNVSEWCSDLYAEQFYATSAAADPEGPVSAGSFHPIRGGSWREAAVHCRGAARRPGVLRIFVGFRVVCELE